MSALVDPDWLQQRLDDSNVRILESSTDKGEYDRAHIPGALWVDHFADLLKSGDDSRGEVVTPEQFARLMGRLGIGPETTVVWYGDRHNSYAIRGYWTMDYHQHRGDFFVLDGGRERWLAEGRPATRDVTSIVTAEYPTPVTWTNENRATWEQVQAAIGQPQSVILDVRSPEEHSGQNRRAARGGHIPGAVNVEWTETTAAPNVLKPEDELRELYESRDVTPDKEVIVHCQLGVRAAHTWFVLKHVLGYSNVKNYDGSWAEWGNRPDLPIEP